MTNDINRMLAAACEDRPIHASIDDVVRRGRRRFRLRRSGGAAVSMLAVGGVLAAVISAWPAGGPSTDGQSTGPAATSDSQPGPASVGDDEVIRRCLELNHQFVTHSSNKAGGGTDPIDDWSVAVTQAQDTWIRAILVSPDEERYAYCLSDERGVDWGDYYREAVDLRADFDVSVSYDDGAEGRVPDGVARLTFETPDGAVSDATIANGFFLWYAAEANWGTDPVWATFYDADGNVLKRVNANAAAVPSCRWHRDGDEFVCAADDGTVKHRIPVHNDKLDCDWELRQDPATDHQELFCLNDAGDGAVIAN